MTNADNIVFFLDIFGSGNSIKIELFGYSNLKAELSWDENWLDGIVQVKAGRFSGRFDASFLTIDFVNFKNQLEKLYNVLEGNAIFSTLEDQLFINIVGDGVGHLNAECVVMDNVGVGNKLEFEIDFDQTYIPKILNQLERIIEKFPKIGNFNQ